jgi:hypothetical protein
MGWDADDAAAKGGTLLDAKRLGWEREIDLSDLSMDDACLCVLGQLYGNWTSGGDALGFSPASEDGVHHGFLAPDDDLPQSDDAYNKAIAGRYVELNTAWRNQVEARLHDVVPA